MFRKNKYIVICYSIRQIMIFITYFYLHRNREHFFNRTTVTKITGHKSATTYKYDSNIDDTEQVSNLGKIMIKNIVKDQRQDGMGVESVSVTEALSHADTLEISCHSPLE